MRPIYSITEKNDRKSTTNKNFEVYSEEAENVFFNSEAEKKETKKNDIRGLNGIRDLINAFEGKSKATNHILLKSRSKSHGHLNKIDNEEKPKFQELFRVFEREHVTKKNNNDNKLKDIDVIKQQTIFLQAKIEDYKFTNATYIECQNEIVELLIKIGEIENDGSTIVAKEKQKCVKLVRNCNVILTRKMNDYFDDIENNKHVSGVNEIHQSIVEIENGGPRVSVLKSIFEDNHKYVPYKDYSKENGQVYQNGDSEEVYQNDYNSDSTLKDENHEGEEERCEDNEEKQCKIVQQQQNKEEESELQEEAEEAEEEEEDGKEEAEYEEFEEAYNSDHN